MPLRKWPLLEWIQNKGQVPSHIDQEILQRKMVMRSENTSGEETPEHYRCQHSHQPEFLSSTARETWKAHKTGSQDLHCILCNLGEVLKTSWSWLKTKTQRPLRVQKDGGMHRHTHNHTHTHSHTHTDTCKHTHAHRHKHTHSTYTNAHMHKKTHRDTRKHTHTHLPTHPPTHTLYRQHTHADPPHTIDSLSTKRKLQVNSNPA